MVFTLSYLFFPVIWFLSLNYFDLIETKFQKVWGRGRQAEQKRVGKKSKDIRLEPGGQFCVQHQTTHFVKYYRLANSIFGQNVWRKKSCVESCYLNNISNSFSGSSGSTFPYTVIVSRTQLKTTLSSVSAFVRLRYWPFFIVANIPWRIWAGGEWDSTFYFCRPPLGS